MSATAIFDLDGTLSDDRRRRHLKPDSPSGNWDEYHRWAPFDPFILSTFLLFEEAQRECKVIVISSRPEKFREGTEQWMFDLFPDFPPGRIFLRPNGNTDPSPVLKHKLYQRVSAHYPLCHDSFAVDDRDDVLDMWASLGLNTVKIQQPKL